MVKIVFVPLIVVAVAFGKSGITGELLGILFLISATPASISSFIMARAMDSDSQLASSIIVVTTLASVFTMGAGVFLLKVLGFLGI